MAFKLVNRYFYLLFLCFHSNWMLSNTNAVTRYDNFQDPIATLELRIQKNLDTIYQEIKQQKQQIEQLENVLAELTKEKNKSNNNLNKELKTLHQKLNFLYQKQNALHHMLSKVRHLIYLKEDQAQNQLLEIERALTIISKNKLPKFSDYKTISKFPYQRTETDLYSKELSSLCNLTISPDGKTLATVYEDLFEYTDPKISTHFKNSDFVNTKVRFLKTQKDYLLELKFILHSPQAKSVYGNPDGSSQSRMDFINGDFIYLQVFATSNGIVDAQQNTVYHIQYKLDKEEINKIRKNELDKLTVFWTSGIEQYDICRINLLQNMFECIRKRKLPN